MENTIKDFKDLPKIISHNPGPNPKIDSDKKPVDMVKDMYQMVIDIHRVLCPQPVVEEPKKRRPRYRDQLYAFMKHGEVYIAEDFITLTTTLGVENPSVHNISTQLNKLVLDGIIVRVRAGIYKLPDEHKPVEESHA